MNAPEHYAEAERTLNAIDGPLYGDSAPDQGTMALMAVAHALLAIGSELGIPPQPHPAIVQLHQQMAQRTADSWMQPAQAAAGGQQ